MSSGELLGYTFPDTFGYYSFEYEYGEKVGGKEHGMIVIGVWSGGNPPSHYYHYACKDSLDSPPHYDAYATNSLWMEKHIRWTSELQIVDFELVRLP